MAELVSEPGLEGAGRRSPWGGVPSRPCGGKAPASETTDQSEGPQPPGDHLGLENLICETGEHRPLRGGREP